MQYLELAGPAPATGAGSTLELLPLAELHTYLKRSTDAAFDGVLQKLLDVVHWEVFRLTGGRFILRDATAFDHVLSVFEATKQIYLPQLPVGTITSVDIGSMTADATFTSTKSVATTEFYSNKEGGVLYAKTLGGSWPRGRHSIRVVYTAGFATVPEDIKGAVAQIVSVKFQRGLDADHGRLQVSQGTQGYVLTQDDIPKPAMQVIRNYALPGIEVVVPYG